MTKEEIAELIDKMPQGMDADDYIYELVNRALAVERKWVGLDGEIPGLGLVTDEFYNGMKTRLFAEDILKEKNT
jgi:hypothetical protein